MMKKKFTGAAALGLCLALGISMGASADSRKVVTLGADLTDQQKQIVMNYFGVTSDQVDILTITNQDERDHLGSYVPLEQIGTHTYSCALVSPTSSGGIQVKTANLDWVTCNMIATTLSTSGVVNCDVIAAAPIRVSGTGALTGIIMAYEQASGETLNPQKKELATEELVITGQLADNVGQKEATAIVNEAKTEIISQNITDITVIQNIVNEAASAHNDHMTQKANWLTEQNFKSLHYTSSNGTDFTVELIPGAKWGSAGDINHVNGAFFVPNMPTEEVFTSPMRGKCEGRLVSTKPLSRSGQVINNFTVDFKDGRVVDCHAEEGEEVLKKMFSMDEGASMLGEVALVPKESPINQSGLMFFNTLFDENACCHVAAGRGFSEVIEGFMDMTDEEIYAKGINDSIIHMDFMIGSDDLHIVGIREDGSETDIFVNGTWAE